MAILKLQEAVDARVKLDIDPLELAINEHLKLQRTVDYVSNPEIVNPSIRVNVDGAQLTVPAQAALKASVEAAAWKSVEVIQTAKGVTVAFSKNEKDPAPEPDVYVATVTADKTTLAPGEFAQLTVVVTKNGAPYTATPVYTSGQPPFATVDATGKVTAVATGTAVITVKEGDLYSKTISIVVTAA